MIGIGLAPNVYCSAGHGSNYHVAIASCFPEYYSFSRIDSTFENTSFIPFFSSKPLNRLLSSEYYPHIAAHKKLPAVYQKKTESSGRPALHAAGARGGTVLRTTS